MPVPIVTVNQLGRCQWEWMWEGRDVRWGEVADNSPPAMFILVLLHVVEVWWLLTLHIRRSSASRKMGKSGGSIAETWIPRSDVVTVLMRK
jgi:hypothetical protein